MGRDALNCMPDSKGPVDIFGKNCDSYPGYVCVLPITVYTSGSAWFSEFLLVRVYIYISGLAGFSEVLIIIMSVHI